MTYSSYETIFIVIVMVKRNIVEIDEEKCNGCGECIPNCVEGALKIIKGKRIWHIFMAIDIHKHYYLIV